MLNIILVILTLIILSIAIFFFPILLFIPAFFAMLLLGISIVFLLQDALFKTNSVAFDFGNLLLKITYFLLIFAICANPSRSMQTYIFYGAIIIAGLFDIFAMSVFRFKRQDPLSNKETQKTLYSYLSYAQSPKKLKKQSGIFDNSQKFEALKSLYYAKASAITAIVNMLASAFIVSLCESINRPMLNIICLALITVMASVQLIFTFLSIKSIKVSWGYKAFILIMAFSISIFGFTANIYLSEHILGAIFTMLSYAFFGVLLTLPLLAAFYYNNQLADVEKEQV